MQALAIREKSFGAMHPEVAQSMANLAVVSRSKSNSGWRKRIAIENRFQ
ncbi:hypothetical protein BH09VER1_BH09VER1_43610 [soil metagenome]